MFHFRLITADSETPTTASATISAPLKRQGDADNTKIENKKRKIKKKRVKLSMSRHNDMVDRHDGYHGRDAEDYVYENDTDSWEVTPLDRFKQEIDERYTVDRKFKGKCGWGWRCDYYCQECKKCIHQFECDCEDGREGEMCEHIHLVCRYLEEKDEEKDTDQKEDDDQKSNEGNKEEEKEEEGSSDSEEEYYSEDEDETDQRKASSIISEMEMLFQEARDLVTDKKNADIIKQNLQSTIALVRDGKSQK